MAKFLNRDQLNEWIPRLINESEKELIIIVPFIRTSDRLFKHLLEANKRGVETTLVYKESKLHPLEKQKLESLDNLNLFHHPNVHAKCYYNEKYLIIASMNLYEYSEINNREMGVLLHKEVMEDENLYFTDGEEIFEDAIHEVKAIINSSHLEKQSRETNTVGFEMEIIKTQKERTEEECKFLNKIFVHKRFEAAEIDGNWVCHCKSYYDNIDLTFSYRVVIDLSLEEKVKEDVFKKMLPFYHLFRFEGFKYYWNNHNQSIYLYKESKHKYWNYVKTTEEEVIKFKQGIDQLIEYFRKFIKESLNKKNQIQS